MAIAVLYIFIGATPPAEAKSCKELAESLSGYTLENEICYCGSHLSNLTATLPPSLRIEAVCGLRYGVTETRAKTHWIDLTKEKVDLDGNSEDGDYPQGFVMLSGVMKETLVGKVFIQESEAGTFFGFTANSQQTDGPILWKYHLMELDLGSDDDYKKLRALRRKNLRDGCREAEAEIRIRNPRVLLGGTDEAGTYAEFEVLRVSKYKPCG